MYPAAGYDRLGRESECQSRRPAGGSVEELPADLEDEENGEAEEQRGHQPGNAESDADRRGSPASQVNREHTSARRRG